MNKLSSAIAFSLALFILSCNFSDDTNTISASGTLEANSIIVSSKVAGEVKHLNVEEGSLVKIGDTLLVIDSDIYALQLKQADAAVEMAEAQLRLLQKGARREDIEQANAALNQSEINFEAAERDFNRIKKLFEEATISQKQMDDAKSRYDISRAQLNAAKENFTKIKNLARPEEVILAEAKVKQAIAARDLLQKNLDDCTVTARINGIVSKKYFQHGEVVSPLASLFKITDLSRIDLVIYVSEVELPRIKLGQKAEITIDAFKEKKYEGKIVHISPEAEFTPKNIQTADERTKLVFAVKIELINDSLELKSGLPADAFIKL